MIFISDKTYLHAKGIRVCVCVGGGVTGAVDSLRLTPMGHYHKYRRGSMVQILKVRIR